MTASRFAPSVKNRLKAVRHILYWVLPPVILYLIFRRIDFGRIEDLARTADIRLILSSVLLIVFVTLAGALRWHFLLWRFDYARVAPSESVVVYWSSLAVGILAPGSLGSDAYRVMLLGQKYGRYFLGAFMIGVEKLAALASCAVLIAGLYPLLQPQHLPGYLNRLIDVLYAIGLAGAVFGMLLLSVRRKGWTVRLTEAFDRRLGTLVQRVSSLSSSGQVKEDIPSGAALKAIASAFSPNVALPAVAFSLAVHAITAVQAQLYFHALGYDINFLVNLFVTPVLFLLFTLPISFGSIGIREGAFILLYGAFGVPPETALVVSFCGLLSILLSYAIGAGIFLLHRKQPCLLGSGKFAPRGCGARRRNP